MSVFTLHITQIKKASDSDLANSLQLIYSVITQTIREIWMTELQVLAGTGGVALRAQRVFHLLNLQFQGIERSEDLLHAVVVVLVVGVHSRVVHLAGVDVPTTSALHGRLHGERVDDVAGWSLKRWTGECR